jgi:hypothetical protein
VADGQSAEPPQKAANLGVALGYCEVAFRFPELLNEECGRKIGAPEQIGSATVAKEEAS